MRRDDALGTMLARVSSSRKALTLPAETIQGALLGPPRGWDQCAGRPDLGGPSSRQILPPGLSFLYLGTWYE
jgi:hypothetical protein